MSHVMVLESSMRHEHLGRYSYLMADPVHWVTPDTLDELPGLMQPYRSEFVPDLPPFQGGLAGLIGYEHNRKLERIPPNRYEDFPFPPLAFGVYDVVIAFDHARGEAWLISHGWSASRSETVSMAAERRVQQFLDRLHGDPEPDSLDWTQRKPIESLAPQYPVPGPDGLTSNFSKQQYLDAVQKCIDYIYAGDVFQINLAQRLLAPATSSAEALFMRLRGCNPAPFSGYFDLGHSQIISASPERFLAIRNGEIETRPIKGTRRRTRFPQIDLAASQQLLSSEKDRAENIMIVDLMRNDLSRICEDDSIEVTQLCELEKYQSVFHLVSAIRGRLRPDQDISQTLKATFPGGSITGAPKVRAMEIIAELEPTSRGAYCGSLGYIGIDGSADFNILIRTITASQGWWQIPVGGGLVAQSDPLREYEETWTKAAGMLAALASGGSR